MYKQKTAYFLVVAVVFVASSIISSTVVLGQTNNALVTKTPEQSNLIIDCSFGESGKEDCSIKHFFQLANNVMKLLLWVAITGAGLLIFYKGTKLAVNVFTKGGHQQARKEVQDALRATLVGLLFILSAYLIVKAGFDIIGYNLNDGDPFKYDESSLPTPDVANLTKSPTPDPVTPTEPVDTTPATEPTAPEPAEPTEATDDPIEPTESTGPDPGQQQQPTSLQRCPGCQTETASILGVSFKDAHELCTNKKNKPNNEFNQTDACWVSKGVGEKLQKLAGQSSAKWRVTEACPPTLTHQNSCHKPENCTCVDANFTTTTPNATNIVAFIRAAKDSGFKAVYEVKNKSRYDNLKGPVTKGLEAEGFSESEAQKRIDHISTIGADHFSLYSQ